MKYFIREGKKVLIKDEDVANTLNSFIESSIGIKEHRILLINLENFIDRINKAIKKGWNTWKYFGYKL